MGVTGTSRLRGFVALAMLTGPAAAIAGEVVIHERPDGTVVITDAPAGRGETGPAAGQPDAAEGDATPGPTRTPTARPPSGNAGSARTGPAGAPEYAVDLRAPAPDAVIWADDARLRVTVAVEPDLVVGHRLRVRLGDHAGVTVDGGGVVELHPVPRGSYPLRAEVIDGDGAVVAASPPRTIHVKQHSRLHPGTAD